MKWVSRRLTVHARATRRGIAHGRSATVGRGLSWCLLLSGVILTGCNPDSPEAQAVVTSGTAPQLSLARLSELAARQSGDAAHGPIVFPDDLHPHPDAVAESYGLRAILWAEGAVSRGPMAMQIRLDRLALARQSDESSAWEYSDVMRSLTVVEVAGDGQAERFERQAVQRGALDLAGSEKNEMFITNTRLALQSTDSSSQHGGECRVRIDVDARLPGVQPGLAATPQRLLAEAEHSVSTTSPSRDIALQLDIRTCPDTLELGGIRQWQARGIPVFAIVGMPDGMAIESDSARAESEQWQGRAWLTHGWGALPVSGGAVLIDTAELYLESSDKVGGSPGLLSVSRSKRRSGRGPETVQGELSDQDQPLRSVELQWDDSEQRQVLSDGSWLPSSIEIGNADKSISLQLTPLVSPGKPDNSEEARWSGAVLVSGSRNGVGFVEYQIVPARDETQ